MSWIDALSLKLSSNVVYQILNYVGSPLPFPKPEHFYILQKHFMKRYCRICGKYMPLYNTHRHYPRQRYFHFRPLYMDKLKVAEMLYISKTNYKITPYTQWDVIIFWQNLKTSYSSFFHCINNDRIMMKLKCQRHIYFTDIGITSTNTFWYIDEWNSLYPHIKYRNDTGFDFREKDILWTPNLIH